MRTKNQIYAKLGNAWIGARKGRAQLHVFYYDSASRRTKGGGSARIGAADCERDPQLAAATLALWCVQHNALPAQAAEVATVGALVADYYEQHARHLPCASAAKAGCAHVVEYFGAMAVSALEDEAKIAAYIKLRHGAIKYATINKELGFLRAALNRAYDTKKLTGRPPKVRGIASDKVEAEEEVAEVFTRPQLRALLRHATGYEHFFRALVIMLATGCRTAAALELAPAQVDLVNGVITLNPKGRAQTKKRRPTVKLPDAARPYFVAWLHERAASPVKLDPRLPLVLWKGKPLRSIKKIFARIVRGDMGLEGRYIPYSIRHTVATELNAQGIDKGMISEHLGHTRGDVGRVTGRYMRDKFAHIRPEYLRATTAGIDALLADVLPREEADNVVNLRINQRA